MILMMMMVVMVMTTMIKGNDEEDDDDEDRYDAIGAVCALLESETSDAETLKKITSSDDFMAMLGNFASQDLYVCLGNVCGSFAEHCGDLRSIAVIATYQSKKCAAELQNPGS